MLKNLQEMPADPSTPLASSPVEAPIPNPSMMGGEAQINQSDEVGMRDDLERMFEKVENKNAALEKKQIFDSEKLEGLKSKIVKEIFSLMKELGVDLSDLKSINEFLQKLQQQDPDLYTMLESAISSLSSEEMTPGMIPKTALGMVPGMETPPIASEAEAKSTIPGMEVVPNSMPAPVEEGGENLMENNTTNLQENILRQ